MKTSEIREKSREELARMLEEKREAVMKLRFDMATRQVKNKREIRNTKKAVSRILTIIKEKNESGKK